MGKDCGENQPISAARGTIARPAPTIRSLPAVSASGCRHSAAQRAPRRRLLDCTGQEQAEQLASTDPRHQMASRRAWRTGAGL